MGSEPVISKALNTPKTEGAQVEGAHRRRPRHPFDPLLIDQLLNMNAFTGMKLKALIPLT
jgi:hypothetical protein